MLNTTLQSHTVLNPEALENINILICVLVRNLLLDIKILR